MRPNKQLGFAAKFLFNLQRWGSHLKLTVTTIVFFFYLWKPISILFISLYLSFVCLFVLLDPYFNVKSTLKLHKVRFLLHEFWLYSTLICSPPLSYCWYTIEISIAQIKFGWIVNILLQLEDAKEWETRCSWFYHVV